MNKEQLKQLFANFIDGISEGNLSEGILTESAPQLLTEDICDPVWKPVERSLQEASDILTENPEAPMRLVGLFQEANKKNQNGRVYPLSILEREVKRLQPIIAQKRLTGELDHPQTSKIRMREAAFYITRLWVEGEKVYGEIEPTTTRLGMDLRARIRDKSLFGISSRGVGSLQQESNGSTRVQEDYHMLTFDVVTDPSVYQAFLYNDDKTTNNLTAEDNIESNNVTRQFFELMDKYFSQNGNGVKKND